MQSNSKELARKFKTKICSRHSTKKAVGNKIPAKISALLSTDFIIYVRIKSANVILRTFCAFANKIQHGSKTVNNVFPIYFTKGLDKSKTLWYNVKVPSIKLNMAPWPSGKAQVCKTSIPQFKSGWRLQKNPARKCGIFVFFLRLLTLI